MMALVLDEERGILQLRDREREDGGGGGGGGRKEVKGSTYT